MYSKVYIFRKVRAFCTRTSKLNTACGLCDELIAMNEKNVRAHVYSHSLSPLFVCKICQRGFMEQHLILEHLCESHPGKLANVSYLIANFNVFFCFNK